MYSTARLIVAPELWGKLYIILYDYDFTSFDWTVIDSQPSYALKHFYSKLKYVTKQETRKQITLN
jgi:hypothetical protein